MVNSPRPSWSALLLRVGAEPEIGECPGVPPSPPAPSPSAPGLPLRVKLAYGAPSFAGAGMAIPIVIHLTIFYSDEILVPLGFIALIKAVARAFDALTDPVMGRLTDHTRTRWGRRRRCPPRPLARRHRSPCGFPTGGRNAHMYQGEG